MQPGYLRELLPESAPPHPDTLQDVLNGEVFLDILSFFLLLYCFLSMLH